MSESKPDKFKENGGNIDHPFHSTKKISRRAAITGIVGAAGVALVQTAAGQVVQKAAPKRPEVPDDPTKFLGAGASRLGLRSPFEQLFRRTGGGISSSAGTPQQALYGLLTPADLHFERIHAGVPAIDPERHELLIHGMVDRPMVFTLADLKRMPAVHRICFIECGGNSYWDAPMQATPGDICPLFSQSEWTGVMLSTLMRYVGAKLKATWFLAEGSDAAVLTRSIPMSKAWDDAMIVYGQNGEAVRPSNGYPMRLLLPGWEGNANVKWIRRIELSDGPFQTRQETARYTEPLPNGKIRQFSFVEDARSLITFPARPNVIRRGLIEIRGIAWSGRGRVRRVDISTDKGKTWHEAKLEPPFLPKASTRFTYLWKWDGKATGIASRCVDETGYIQPTRGELLAARGRAGVGYHANHITAWEIKPSGEVHNWPYFLP